MSVITEPTVIARADHGISRKQISSAALKVLYRLRDAGYEGYLVGGGVRDLLLGLQPKDFDVATNALPEQVREVFSNSRLIGRRFRLAHVRFGREIIEVATFRAGAGQEDDDDDNDNAQQVGEDGRLLRDNVYGSLEDDALRRDFSVNALYYSIEDFAVRDFAGGYQDLAERRLRLIGDPVKRYREDPVRMLRAVRFAAKLGLEIDDKTAEPIKGLVGLLDAIPPARLFDEVLKLFMSGHASATFHALRRFGLFAALFPEADAAWEQGQFRALMEQALSNTDERIAIGKPVTPAFLYAALLWPGVVWRLRELEDSNMPMQQRYDHAADGAITRQLQHTSIPRRFSTPMREIWHLQPRFERQHGKRVLRFMSHRRFRAAYDFLLLRELEESELAQSAEFWTNIQEQSEDAQRGMALKGDGKKRRRKRRRKKSKPAGNESD